jgi:hypothetical protein
MPFLKLSLPDGNGDITKGHNVYLYVMAFNDETDSSTVADRGIF